MMSIMAVAMVVMTIQEQLARLAFVPPMTQLQVFFAAGSTAALTLPFLKRRN